MSKVHPVQASDLVIQSCSVEVAVVRIQKKQMSLAVFRQIPYSQIIHEYDVCLRGRPWGIVN